MGKLGKSRESRESYLFRSHDPLLVEGDVEVGVGLLDDTPVQGGSGKRGSLAFMFLRRGDASAAMMDHDAQPPSHRVDDRRGGVGWRR